MAVGERVMKKEDVGKERLEPGYYILVLGTV